MPHAEPDDPAAHAQLHADNDKRVLLAALPTEQVPPEPGRMPLRPGVAACSPGHTVGGTGMNAAWHINDDSDIEVIE